MATVVVAFDGTRVSAANTLSDGGTWFEWNSAKSPTIEPDFVYQSSASISNKVGTKRGGVALVATTPVDYSGTPKVILFKSIITNPGVLNNQGSSGATIYVGSTTNTNRWLYYVVGGDTYPPAGGWLFTAIDPNESGYADSTEGTPVSTAMNYYALSADFSGTSKAENVAFDAIDYVDVGTGLTITRGDSTSADGTFDDFVTADEGSPSTGRWGLVRTQEGVLYVNGVLTIGDANPCEFTDSNKVIVFPDGRFGAGTCGIDFNVGSTATVITVADSVFNGTGNTTTADSRPDYEVVSTGGTLVLSGINFDVFRNIVLSTGATLTNCNFLNGLSLTQNSAPITGCNVSGATTGDGVAFLTSDNLSLITDCEFTFSDGHAIEITSSGTYTLTDTTFTGYGSSATNDAAIYQNSGGGVIINVSGGTTPTVRNGTGSTTNVNNTVNLTFTGLSTGLELRVFDAGTTTVLDGIENTSTSFVYSFEFASSSFIDLVVHDESIEYFKQSNILLPATNTSIPVVLRDDRNYSNPA